MKKYTRKDFSPRGSLPPQLFKYIDMSHISDATAQFSEYVTKLAQQFHSRINVWGGYSDLELIELDTPDLFGQPVKLEYIDSGVTGTVYKFKIGSETFVLKINRSTRMATDELENMHMYNRARNLVNKTYIAAPFKYEGDEFTWLLSDYVGVDYKNSFKDACEKLYYAYITKGIAFSDGHYHNVKNGKIIDSDSFRFRIGGMDDFYSLNRKEVDSIKKLMYYIKTNKVLEFENLLKESNKTLVDYLYFSMLYARGQFLGGRSEDDALIKKLIKFEMLVSGIKTALKEHSKVGKKLPSDLQKDR
jgi:hypothetical protein